MYEYDVVYVDSYEQAINRLLSGEIDAFFEENSAIAAFDAHKGIRATDYFPLVYSSVSLTSADPELAPIIDVIDKYLQIPGRPSRSATCITRAAKSIPRGGCLGS